MQHIVRIRSDIDSNAIDIYACNIMYSLICENYNYFKSFSSRILKIVNMMVKY